MAEEPTYDKPKTQADKRDSVAPSRWQAVLSADRLREATRRVGYRSYRLIGETVSVALTVGIAVLFFSVGLLSRQSADMSSLKPTFELWFSQGFNGAQANLGGLELNWQPSNDTVSIVATDITVYDRDGGIVQSIPKIKATTTKAGILTRKPRLKDIDIVGGVVTWREAEDGSLTVGLGTPETVGRFGPVFRGETDPAGQDTLIWLEEFETLSLVDSRAHIVRESDGLDIVLDVEQLTGKRNESEIRLNLDGQVARLDGEPAGRVSLSFASGDNLQTSRIELTAEALNPSLLTPETGRLAALGSVNLPLNIRLQAERHKDGQITAANLDLSSGEGTIGLAGDVQPVDALRFEGSLNPGDEVMTVKTVSLTSDRLSFSGGGILSDIGRLSDGDVGTSPKFDLFLTESRLDLRPQFERPIDIEDARAVGEFDLDSRRLTLDRLTGRFETVDLDLSGLVATSDAGLARLQLQGRTRSPMTAPELLAMWPVKAADGARRWIDRAVLDGTIENVRFSVDLDGAFFNEPILTPENLQLDFDVSDGLVRYISTMDPLVDAVGSGRIDGNRFGFVLESGRINDVTIVGGDVDIPRLVPKGGDILISVEGQGTVAELLSIVNQPPFQYLDKYGVDPADFGGTADITLNIKRPLLEYFDEDRIEYSVSGKFTDASAPFEFGGYELVDADVTLRGGKEGLFIEGPASLGPWRADLTWAERYGQNGEPTRYRMSGTMDRKTLDGFGLGFRQVFGGELGVDIEASGQGLNVTDAVLDIDFERAELTVSDVWSKALGEPGTVRATIEKDAQTVSIPHLSIVAPGLDLQGAIRLREGFALEDVRLDKARIDGLIDGRLVLSRDDVAGRLALDASGQSLDVSTFVKRSLESAGEGDALFALSLDAAFNEIMLAPDYALENASMTYRHDGDAVERLSLRGDRPQGPLLMTLTERDDDVRDARLSVPDISEAAKKILSLDATRDGSLLIEAELPASGTSGPVIGTAVARDFSVRNAPFLAQILSLASLTGIVDTLSGEGLGFDRLSFDFGLQDQTLSIREAKLRGPAIGMTGEGDISLADREIDFSGALVPAYTANSILGDIPLLGDLLIGKDGEGVFAVNYAIEGPFSQALISINPLSALTPGFIRGIFRESRDDLPESVIADIESVRPTEAETTAGVPGG